MSHAVFETTALGLSVHPAIGVVQAVNDPQGLNRVQVQLFNTSGTDDQDFLVWARVAVPFAGSNRGAFFIPDVGDEVLVSFIQGDPRYPVVIGSFWNGNDKAPDSFGGSGTSVDRWVMVGKAGTKIAIVEESSGQPRIDLITPGGVKGSLSDDGGGKISLSLPSGTSITMDTSGATVQTGGTVKVQATQVEIDAGQVTVNAAMSQFNGVVQCTSLMATAMVSSPTYTPGAGNIW
jgi:uncharacterized protein involved in type VI secretion and phage assembly